MEYFEARSYNGQIRVELTTGGIRIWNTDAPDGTPFKIKASMVLVGDTLRLIELHGEPIRITY